MEELKTVEEIMLFNEWLKGRKSTQELIIEFKHTDDYKELVSYLELTRKIYKIK